MKKIAIAICLFGAVASSNATDKEKMEVMYFALSKSSCAFTPETGVFSICHGVQQDAKKIKEETDIIERNMAELSKELSGSSQDLSGDALELSELAKCCGNFFSFVGAAKWYQSQFGKLLDGVRDLNEKLSTKEHMQEFTWLALWLAPLIVPQEQNVPNGMTGMNRDIIIRLVMLIGRSPKKMSDESLVVREGKIRTMMGMSQQHYLWAKNQNFKTVRLGQAIPDIARPHFQKAIEFGLKYSYLSNGVIDAGVPAASRAAVSTKMNSDWEVLVGNIIKAALPELEKKTKDCPYDRAMALFALIRAGTQTHGYTIDIEELEPFVVEVIPACRERKWICANLPKF